MIRFLPLRAAPLVIAVLTGLAQAGPATEVPITAATPAALRAFEDGRALLAEQNVAGAITALDRAIALDPAFAQAYWQRGRARIPVGVAGHALPAGHPARVDFRRAAELARRLAPLERAWLEANLLSAQRGPDDDDAERAAYDRVAALGPKIAMVQERRRAAAMRRADHATALDAARVLVGLEPTAARWGDVASGELARENLDAARVAIQRARELAPQELALIDTEATIALRGGEVDRAIRLFEQILARSPGDAGAVTALAAIDLRRGDAPKARRALSAALGAATKPRDLYELGTELALLELGEGRRARAVELARAAALHGPALGYDPQSVFLAELDLAIASRDWAWVLEVARRPEGDKVWQIHRQAVIGREVLALIELGREAESEARERELGATAHSGAIFHRMLPAEIAMLRAMRRGDAEGRRRAEQLLERLEISRAWLADLRARDADPAVRAAACTDLGRYSRNVRVVVKWRLSPCAKSEQASDRGH